MIIYSGDLFYIIASLLFILFQSLYCQSGIQLNILDLEIKYSELQEFLSGHYSKRAKLFKSSDFISLVFQLQTPSAAEAYLSDLLPQYLEYISLLDPRANDPKDLKTLIDQLEQIKKLKFAETNTDLIDSNISSLTLKLNLLNDWLNGTNTSKKVKAIYFPVLEKTESGYSNGFLESIEVEIKTGDNKFHITPSESESDKELDKQIEICWQIALNICNRYTQRIKPSHTVFVHFVNRYGIYSGSSLGVALTLAFIEALLKYYNTSIIINTDSNISFTGEVDESGTIKVGDEQIIKEKVKTVFFSDTEIFALPYRSISVAQKTYEELKDQYPNRKLEIIGIENIDDLLNRRNLVDIRKQKLVVRTSRLIKRNWISAAAVVLLTMVFTYLFAFDFDDNPALLNSDGTTLFIKNKNGKVLLTKHINLGQIELSNHQLLSIARIIDIDGDRENEVLTTQKFNDNSTVYCYDKRGKVIWSYEFKDSVISKREEPGNNYSVRMIDTLTLNSQKSLLLISKNLTSYPSAIFRINLRTGKRLPGTFWAAGHILEGEIKDIDKDSKKDFIGIGYENGYEDVTFFGFEIDTLLKMRPTKEEYLLEDISRADLKVYIRFPKIDYDKYKKIRTPSLLISNFSDNQHKGIYRFAVGEIAETQISNLSYGINYNFKDIDVIISSGFRVMRDSLVAHGILSQPYTDTREYKEIIKNNILYWQDNKWVHREDLK